MRPPELGVEIEAILITHCHFDHIGAVAPVARATGAPVYCPEIELGVLADIMKWTMPGFGPFESWQAEHTVKGGEQLSSRTWTSRCCSPPGHSPGHVTYAIDRTGASIEGSVSVKSEKGSTVGQPVLLSGDVLFQGSVGRVDLPGGDWATLERSIGMLMSRFERDTVVYPGHMGVTTLGREWDTNPFLAELRAAAMTGDGGSAVKRRRCGAGGRSRRRAGEQIKAPRGTHDVLGEQAAGRAALGGACPHDPRGRGL